MANIRQIQQETFANLDTAIAMASKIPSVISFFDKPSASLTLSTNPMGLLVELMKHLGITYEELVDYISYLLSSVLPVVELGVKGILLSNVKEMVACSIDPRIPDAYRKQYAGEDVSTTNKGFAVTINSIDVLNKLKVSPLSKEGKYMYFGVENINDVYKFVRADDMDAFLWFVIHKSKFPYTSVIPETDFTTSQPFSRNPSNDGWGMTVLSGDSFLDDVKLQLMDEYFEGSQIAKMMTGNVFAHSNNPRVIAMCVNTERQRNSEGYEKIVSSEIIPVSDDKRSINWYVRPKYNFGRSLGWGMTAKSYSKFPRKYGKEKAICNFFFKENTTNKTKNGISANQLYVTILPKPAIHIPKVPHESPFNFRKLLFNANGEPDSNGKYSYSSRDFIDDSTTKWKSEGDYLVYTISEADQVYLTINKITGHYDILNGNYSKNVAYLQECYAGLTVYEFNYDYVMSMRLFDAKTIIMSVLNALFNTNIGLTVSASTTASIIKIENDEKIKTIIKNILEQDDSEVNDCYYTFSNDKYAKLLQKAEERKLQEKTFGDVKRTAPILTNVLEILDDYDCNADLNEQKTIISRTIQQASITISEEANNEDKHSLQLTFLFDFIEELVTAIVNSILSPKVLLVLYINEQLMHNRASNILEKQPTFEEIVKSMESIIVAIVKEVRDLLIKELLKFILQWLNPIKETILSLLSAERINDYNDLIKELMTASDMSEFYSLLKLFLRSFKGEDTELDVVDYPDIDTSSTTLDVPTSNNCEID